MSGSYELLMKQRGHQGGNICLFNKFSWINLDRQQGAFHSPLTNGPSEKLPLPIHWFNVNKVDIILALMAFTLQGKSQTSKQAIKIDSVHITVQDIWAMGMPGGHQTLIQGLMGELLKKDLKDE